jgi:hypothetical protein
VGFHDEGLSRRRNGLSSDTWKSTPCKFLSPAYQVVKVRRDKTNDEKQTRITRRFKLDESQQCEGGDRCSQFRNVDRQEEKS